MTLEETINQVERNVTLGDGLIFQGNDADSLVKWLIELYELREYAEAMEPSTLVKQAHDVLKEVMCNPSASIETRLEAAIFVLNHGR